MLNLAAKRLKVEYAKLRREPIPLAVAEPLEQNILEWRFVIQGIDDYKGGYYHGKLTFPEEYPLKPPSIQFITPNGRFETNKRICMSISDFHPETWSPGWTVGTILTGVVSFFNCDEKTTGSVNTSSEQKQKLALESKAFNQKDKMFVKLFGSNPESLFLGDISGTEENQTQDEDTLNMKTLADDKCKENSTNIDTHDNQRQTVNNSSANDSSEKALENDMKKLTLPDTLLQNGDKVLVPSPTAATPTVAAPPRKSIFGLFKK